MPDPTADEIFGGGTSSQPIIREGADGRLYLIDPTTRQATPIEGMPEDELARLQREIALAEQMAQGDNPDDAYAAQARLKGLNATYARLAGKQAQQQPWTTTSTSTPYLLQQQPDGTMKQIPNPNYLPPGSQQQPKDPEDIQYAQLRNQKLQQDIAGGSPWEQAWKQKEWDYGVQRDEQTRRRNTGNDAWSRAYQKGQGDLAARPWMAIPGQEYFMGAEPGGIMESIARMSGRQYDPEKFRAPIMRYDPEEAWRKAMGQ